MTMRAPKTLLGEFHRREDGGATVEAVLWVPVFVAILCLVVDASLVFFGQNQAYRAVQNGNRNLSIGRLETEGEVETFVESSLSNYVPNARAAASMDAGMISTYVQFPASDVVATGFFTAVFNPVVTVGARHFIEY